MAARSRQKRQSKVHREFVSEAEEALEGMREALADLMDQRAGAKDGAEVSPDLINRIFRAAHSLKGLAGMFGLEALGKLAHHLEDVLDALRLGRMSIDAPAVELLDEAVLLFSSLLEQIGESEFEELCRGPIEAMIARIEGSVEGPATGDDLLDGLDIEPALLRALTEYEEHRLRESLRRGRHLSLVEATFDILSFEEGLAEVSAAIREVGEIVSTLPSPGDAPESQIRFSLLAASDVSPAELGARLELPDVSVRAVGPPGSGRRAEGSAASAPAVAPFAEALAPELSLLEPDVDAESEKPAEAAEIDSLRSISDTVRVDIRKLDELMNLVGELAVQRTSLSTIAMRLAADPATARIGDELSRMHKLFDRKLKELQSGVLDVRMVPLRQVFEKLSRVVRRLRRDLGKDVSISFSGADTELDKLIVEQLIDPLMHVVRNAFDHAIESPEERRAAGKEPQGTIFIAASQRGNHVLIEVSDDGRGIDLRQLRATAEARGVIALGASLSDKETLELVFQAGFSTRETITETSGRGVGMDVVRTNLIALGGMVELDTVLGEGTRVMLTLPITLAIIQALIVGVAGQLFAIPLNSVLETLSVGDLQIQKSDGRELLNLRGEALPLRRLSDEFGLSPSDAPAMPALDLAALTDKRGFVVVLGLGDRRTGLLVDSLHGQQDTVIKPIKGPILDIPGIAGATEQGERGAILVIDVAAIVDEVARRRDAA